MHFSKDDNYVGSLTYLFYVKGTVAQDRFQKFYQKFTEPGLTKGRSWFLKFLGAPMILKRKK